MRSVSAVLAQATIEDAHLHRETDMKISSSARGIAVLSVALHVGTALAAERPEWAFFLPSTETATVNAMPSNSAAQWSAPGSGKSYTRTQVQDVLNPPDWYPDEHPPMPDIVARGERQGADNSAALPCALCHLPNGAGHVESASLAGLSASYIVQQFADFRSGSRRILVGNSNTMGFLTSLKKRYTDDQVSAAAQYFASLKPRSWIRVVETTAVPKSVVSPETLMRTAIPHGGTEPIGDRIVELPESTVGLLNRDSHSGFIAYVPRGSVAAGETLVTTMAADGAPPCSGCHGSRLTGVGDVPPIAGRPPSYLVRQLWDFQSGERRGTSAATMRSVTSSLTSHEMLAIAAYLASRPPN
jgi:cytochrome c553